MRKKNVSAILAACAIIFTGCGTSGNEPGNSTATTQLHTESVPEWALTPTQAETEPITTEEIFTGSPTIVETIPETETIPEQTCISINSYSISKDYNGNPVLVIDYAFTNLESKPQSFTFSVQDTVFQNGIECSSTVFGCDEVDTQQQLNDVQPGYTYNLKVAYALQDMTTATVVVTNLYGTETIIDQKIDLGGGEGETAATAAEGAEPLTISNYHLSKDYEGKDVLVIEFLYTNTESEAEAFIYEFADSAFQNGIECDSTVFGCDDVDSQSQLSEIQPGVSIPVKIGYHIQDMSDVNIIVKKAFTSIEVLNETIALQ